MTAIDERPTLNLGHLVIPKSSAAQDWLRREGVKRQQSTEIVADEAKKWFGLDMPEGFYEEFAARVVTALDHRV
jgi:hypothetical protein